MKKILSSLIIALSFLPNLVQADEFKSFQDNLNIKCSKVIIDVYKDKEEILQLISTGDEFYLRDSDSTSNIAHYKSTFNKITGRTDIEFINNIKNIEVSKIFNLPEEINNEINCKNEDSKECNEIKALYKLNKNVESFYKLNISNKPNKEIIKTIGNFIGYNEIPEIKYNRISDSITSKFKYKGNEYFIICRLFPLDITRNLYTDIDVSNKAKDGVSIKVESPVRNISYNLDFILNNDDNITWPEMVVKKFTKEDYISAYVSMLQNRELTLTLNPVNIKSGELFYKDRDFLNLFNLGNKGFRCSYERNIGDITTEECELLFNKHYSNFIKYYNMFSKELNTQEVMSFINKLTRKKLVIKDKLENESSLIYKCEDENGFKWIITINPYEKV